MEMSAGEGVWRLGGSGWMGGFGGQRDGSAVWSGLLWHFGGFVLWRGVEWRSRSLLEAVFGVSLGVYRFRTFSSQE